MGNGSKVIPWLTERLKQLSLSSGRALKADEDVYKAIGLDESISEAMLTYRFDGELVDSKESLLATHGIDVQHLGIDGIKAFSGHGLSLSDASVIANLVTTKDLNRQDYETISGLSNFGYSYDSQDHEYGFWKIYYPENEIANIKLLSKLIQKLSDDEILQMLNDVTAENANIRTGMIYEQALSRDIYRFKPSDLLIFDMMGADIRSLCAISGARKAQEDEILEDLNDSLLKGELTLIQLKNFLGGRRCSYDSLVRNYPLLSGNEALLACVAFEGMTHDKFQQDIYATARSFLRNQGEKIGTLDEYLNCFDSNIIFSTYVTWLLQSLAFDKITFEALCKTISGIAHLPVSEEDKQIYNNLKFTLDMISHSKITGDKVKDSVGTLGIALLINTFTFPRFSSSQVITFAEEDSDAWYDGYKSTLYGDVTVTAKEEKRDEIEGEIGSKFTMILQACLEKGDYLSVVYQAPTLHSYCAGYFDLFDLEMVIVSAANSLGEDEISKLPEGVKWSLSYFGVKHQCKWLGACIDVMSSYGCVPFSTHYEENDSDIPLTGKIGNGQGIQSCLNISEASLSNTMFSLQVKVIGRVKRDINTTSAMLALCLEEAYQSGAVSFSKEKYQVDTTSKAGGRYSRFRKGVTFTHFPRLRNEDSLSKILVLDAYLNECNLMNHALEQEDGLREGRFDVGETRYVIGEFDWLDIFDRKVLCGSINKLSFILISQDREGKKSVECINVEFSNMTAAELLCLFRYRTINEGIFRQYSKGQTDQLLLSISRFMPAIEHEGVVVNS